MRCPYCLKKNSVYATVGAIRTTCCLNCGKGYESRTQGSKVTKFTLIDFGGLQDEINIWIGRRKVTLAPIPTSERKTYENIYF